MAVAWPSVRARLASQLPTVVGASVTVYDGPVVTGDAPTAYVTVAFQPSTEDEDAGSYEQTLGPDGFSATEVGSVLLEFGAITGDSTVPSAFTMVDALQGWVQKNQTLEGLLVTGSVVTVSVGVLHAQNTAGAVQRLLASVDYTTDVI